MHRRALHAATLPVLSALAMLTSTGAADGQGCEQVFKLLAHDRANEDRFGVDVAIGGGMAIVGAQMDDDHGTNSGSAYLFDLATGEQLHKLLPDDGAAWDGFGAAVAIDGSIAVVGAPGDDVFGTDSGSAHVFDVATGEQIQLLIPDDGAARDWFGVSVAISGTVAIVGAPKYGLFPSPPGSAYLFDVTTGAQLRKLEPNDGGPRDFFGASVAIDGALAIVGAWGIGEFSDLPGSAYVFDVTTGEQLCKLESDDGEAADQFGHSVAIIGTVAVVGAPYDDDLGGNSGSAYLFDVTTGAQLAKLLPNDGATDDLFGMSVAVSGTVAIVGAFFDDDQGLTSGSAFVFDVLTGAQLLKLLPDGGAQADQFGRSVAIGGDTALVGAWGDDTDSGSAYVFTCTCPGDLDLDGQVGFADLLAVLGAWGTPAGDVNGDGATDFTDLLALLSAWGPCAS